MYFWDDWSDAFETLNTFRRQMEHAFRDEVTHMKDTGEGYAIRLFVPGLDEKQLQLSLTEDVLTLKAERAVEAPKGYTTHRQERTPYTFSRTFSFPVKVDPEKVTAELKDGVLNVKVQKAAAAKPRTITIKNAA